MNPARFSGPWFVVQSDGIAIESHSTQGAAEDAAAVLSNHEQRWSERASAGDPLALRASCPGRPFSYHVERRDRV